MGVGVGRGRGRDLTGRFTDRARARAWAGGSAVGLEVGHLVVWTCEHRQRADRRGS